MKAMNRVPGVGSSTEYAFRQIMAGGQPVYLPGGIVIDGDCARDPLNTAGYVDRLRCGMLMGRITTGKLWAPSVVGSTGVALAGTDTQLNLMQTAEATELIRRLGATGTFKLTGPPAASGVVRTLTATYSAVGAGTPVNEVQTATPNEAAASGTYTITLPKPDGTFVTTAAIAFGATLAAAQAAVTLALGSAGWVLSSAGSAAPWSAGPIALVFTASGTGYTYRDYAAISVDSTLLIGASGALTCTVAETTKGVPMANTVTITALGVNEVQTINMDASSTAGNIAFRFTDPTTGLEVTTSPAAWNAADATYLSSIQDALDAATGVANAIVASTTADTDDIIVLTFSGTGYAGLPHPAVVVTTLPTSTLKATVTRTTEGVNGAFIAGSLIQPVDGSETPLGLLGMESGIKVTDDDGATNLDVEASRLIIGSGNGVVDASQIVNYPSDASLKTWVKDALRAVGSGYVFDDDHVG